MRSPAAGQPSTSPPHRTAVASGRAVALWLSLALLIVTAAVYLPVRHYDFVNYDDPQYVRDNPDIRAGVSPRTLLWACTSFQLGNWHPLTTFSYLLDSQLFGLDPGAYHLVNAALHVLNTLLLFWILGNLTGALWPSAVVAALFALHPLHVESVAWIAERKDVLSTFFWLLTLGAYVAYVRRPNGRRYGRLLAAYGAALLSKPMVVTLPFVLLLIDFWPLGRWGVERAKAETRQPTDSSLASLIIEKLPLFLLAGIVAGLTYAAQAYAGAVDSSPDHGLGDRLAHITFVYVLYLWKMLWPTDLAVFYPFAGPVPTGLALAAATVLLAITAAVVWAARRHRYLLTGWLWYLGMLVPVIGFVQQGAQARADRFTYLPLVGIFIMAAWGIPDLLRRWQHGRLAYSAAAVAILAACTAVTVRQLSFWRNSTSLFEHALAVTQDNLLAQSLIGTLEMDDGQRDKALHNLSEAARICDTSRGETTICTQAHYNTGLLLAKRGDLNGAQEHYRAALRFDPRYAKANLGLGLIDAARGDLAAAAAAYREALHQDPTLASAHNNLAIVLENLGHTDEAIVEYTEGVRLEPQDAATRCNLGAALASAGRLPEAIEQFRGAVQLKPQLAEARFGLASAYAQAGDAQAAIAGLDELLSAHPGETAIEATLAWVLATADDPRLRNAARAVQLAEAAASRTDLQDPDVLNSLAAAYAEAGRFDEAVRTAEAAEARARTNHRVPLADALAERLVSYRAGRPVRAAKETRP